MLPRFPTKDADTMTRTAGRRYVDYAIRDLARQFDQLGARRNEVEVKVFGGGDVLAIINDPARPTVGHLNSEMAMKVLEEEGFHIVASSLGGKRGVNIDFNTMTGEILLKRHT
jgi:chemotaxis protein CheD